MMRCPQHPSMANPWCNDCARAMGWPVPLSIAERDKLRFQVERKEVSRDALKKMKLTEVDRQIVEQHLPKVREPLSSPAGTPDRIEQIAATIEGKTWPPVHDPIAFLHNAAESRLMPLLDTDDFDAVMRWRHNVRGEDQS
jgi:hypothetical protein